jgi:hypothetical protein
LERAKASEKDILNKGRISLAVSSTKEGTTRSLSEHFNEISSQEVTFPATSSCLVKLEEELEEELKQQ